MRKMLYSTLYSTCTLSLKTTAIKQKSPQARNMNQLCKFPVVSLLKKSEMKRVDYFTSASKTSHVDKQTI